MEALGGRKGYVPPLGSTVFFFHFEAFYGEDCQNNSWRPHLMGWCPCPENIRSATAEDMNQSKKDRVN